MLARRLTAAVLAATMGCAPGVVQSAIVVASATGVAPGADVPAIEDATPPIGEVSLWDVDPRQQVFDLRLTFADPESGIDHVDVACDDLPSVTYPMAEHLLIPYFDPTRGGCESDGHHWIAVQATNGAGLTTWSATGVTLGYVVEVAVSASPTTGRPVTFTPVYPAPYEVPDDATCRWELRWGDNDALLHDDYNATFGSLLLEGSQSDGFCGPWTFTLPYTQLPHFQVSFKLESDTHEIGGDRIGFKPDGSDIIRADVGTTERRITESNLPVMMVLPDAYIAVVDKPVTYRLYPVAGAEYDANDGWIAGFEAGQHLTTQDGGGTFTFTPDRVGNWVVFWNAMSKEPFQLGAGYDPPAKRPDRTDPTTTAPVTRLDGRTAGARIPATVRWKGGDTGWGVDHYTIQRSVDGGPWGHAEVAFEPAADVALRPGHAYRFRVRAYDRAGNAGGWDAGPVLRVRAVQESSDALAWTGQWTRVADPAAWGGRSRQAGTARASVAFGFTGRSVAWVAGRCADRGTATVYVDGAKVATVDLASASADPRRVVWQRSWSDSSTHRVRIVVVGGGSTPIVDIDGFIVLR